MNTIWAIVGVLALLVAIADVVYHWKTRQRRQRDPICFQDWQATERRQRVANFKAPAAKGFDGQGERRLRRRSS